MPLSTCILPGKPFHICQERTSELSTITSLYQDMRSSSVEPVVTTLYLTGPPGSGKTQLARQFGEQFLKTTPTTTINPPLALTLNAESVQSLLKSTKDVTKKLGLTTEPKKKPESYHETYLVRFYLEELRKFLQSCGVLWLLILDNMFYGEEINDILPQPGSKDWGEGKVLVTSQDNDIVPACHEYAKMHSLNDGMTREDGLNLLKKVSGVDVDQFAVQLAEESGFFPLALSCAATYVGETRQDRASARFSWEQYLAVHREEKHQLEYRTFSKNNVYPITMMAAATLAVKRMAERSDVLRLTFDFLSYCAMHPVPLVLLASVVHADLPPGQTQSCREVEAEISRCSLLMHVKSDFTSVETVKFHQIMSDAFQHVRNQRSDESNEIEFVAILKSLNENLKPTDECSDQFVSIAIKILMRPHLQSFVDHANAKKWNNTAEFVLITMKVGQFLYQVSNMPAAEVVKSLESVRQIALDLQLSDIQYCDILANIGFYNLELYILDKALEILNEAYAMTEGHETDKEWLKLKCRILNNLSRNYDFLGKQRLATENMRQSIDIAKVVFGEDRVMNGFLQLAVFYLSKSEITEMKEVCNEASRFLLTRKTDGNTLKRASSLNTLAIITLLSVSVSCTDCSDKLYDAECFFSHSLRIYEEILGKDIYSCSFLGYQLVAYALFCHSLNYLTLRRELMQRVQNIFTQSQDTLGISLAAAFNKRLFNAKPKVDWVSFFFAPIFAESRTVNYHEKSAFEDVLDDCESGKIRPSRRYEETLRRCRSPSGNLIWRSRILNFLVWVFIIAYWLYMYFYFF